MQFLINHIIIMNSLVVSVDSSNAVGVAGSFKNQRVLEPGSIGEYDPTALTRSKVLGKRVAEMAKIVKAGVQALRKDLPEEYANYVLDRQEYTQCADALNEK